MADKLVVENRGAELGARSLASVGFRAVAAHSIIPINYALTIFADSTKKVESVVRHKTSAVKSS